MSDLFPHYNNVLTLLNLLAERGKEQQEIKLGYDKACAYCAYAAGEYLGQKLAELSRRHIDKLAASA